MSTNPNHHEQQKAHSDTTAQQRRDYLDTLLRVFDTPDGERILASLHASAGTRKPCFVATSNGVAVDPYTAAYRDGRHSILWEIEANLTEARAGGPTGPTISPASGPRARR